PARVDAVGALKKDMEVAHTFLKDFGMPESEVRASAVSLTELTHEETTEKDKVVLRRTIFDGWQASQQILVSSNDVARVERLSREATQLLEKGLVITSGAPRY